MTEDDKKIWDRLNARLSTNMLRLDQELTEMPMLVMDATEAAAFAYSARDMAQHDLAVAEASAAAKLREIPAGENRDGTPKMRSETQIASELSSQRPVKEARTKVEEAKLDASLWSALVDALRTKSKSLDRVSDLMIAGYLTPDSIGAVRSAEMRRRPTKRE